MSQAISSNQIEQRSLRAGLWANLVMGVSGVTAATLSRSDALMVDGLYSGVNFVSTLIAGRIALSATKRPDRHRPFGYETNESLYVLFRSLVLLGILIFAMANSGQKIAAYLQGETMPELIFGPIVVYSLFMVVICFGLAAWHHHNWNASGKASEILKTEKSAAVIDGLLSAGAGAALMGVTFLKGTVFAGIIPIADALIVLVLGSLMIASPLTMLKQALKEVSGHTVDQATVDQVRVRLTQLCERIEGTVLEVAVTKAGRKHFVVAWVRPDQKVSANDLDTFREEALGSYQDLFNEVTSEVIYTGQAPFAEPQKGG